ncbi:MAG: RNA-directed DNA polymerase [Parvibaculum sp.]|nr:RNA-directed DNA polymerase [Parvibaculum sp.]
MHPITSHDLAEFIDTRWEAINAFISSGTISQSVPEHTPDADRAFKITSHNELDQIKYDKLSHHRFIARTDVSRFYHSIYTHSLPWAFHGKAVAKGERSVQSAAVYFNRVDFILRQSQDGQTIGIPVGPDASRVLAEVLAAAIDREFIARQPIDNITVLRHVDDVWIGANSYSDAEQALWKYREAIRSFELDINESKTHIYAEGFHFVEEWPTEIASRIEFAFSSPEARQPERLRAALEYAFNLAVAESDDGVLRYAIRYVDEAARHWESWPTLNAFLKRVAAHFGHAIDFVVRVIVWRQLTSADLDIETWTPILLNALRQHGRLGNDSETCWILYACFRLEIVIDAENATQILGNCGALSLVALLSAAHVRFAPDDTFDHAANLLSSETANGAYWPVFLEWLARDWRRSGEIRALAANPIILEMADGGTTIFEQGRLPPVFEGVSPDDYRNVLRAIERNVSYYDGDDDEIIVDEDGDEDDAFF